MLGKFSGPLIIQMFGTQEVQDPAVQPELVLCIQVSQHHIKQDLTHFFFPSGDNFHFLFLFYDSQDWVF